jgi:hypothetical protein
MIMSAVRNKIRQVGSCSWMSSHTFARASQPLSQVREGTTKFIKACRPAERQAWRRRAGLEKARKCRRTQNGSGVTVQRRRRDRASTPPSGPCGKARAPVYPISRSACALQPSATAKERL